MGLIASLAIGLAAVAGILAITGMPGSHRPTRQEIRIDERER